MGYVVQLELVLPCSSGTKSSKKKKVDANSNVRFMSMFPDLSQNYLGPLTMVENIDKLLWTLADELWAERKSFTVSTKNMGTVFFLLPHLA